MWIQIVPLSGLAIGTCCCASILANYWRIRSNNWSETTTRLLTCYCWFCINRWIVHPKPAIQFLLQLLGLFTPAIRRKKLWLVFLWNHLSGVVDSPTRNMLAHFNFCGSIHVLQLNKILFPFSTRDGQMKTHSFFLWLVILLIHNSYFLFRLIFILFYLIFLILLMCN